MSLSSVVTAGYLPDPDASLPLVTLFGYSNGAEAPPPPPPDAPTSFYGPALSPADRRRWFSDDENYESPEKREIRRKSIERLKRIEIGLLPSDELQQVIEAKVAIEIAKPEITARAIGKPKVDTVKAVERVVSKVAADIKAEEKLRQDLEDEEKEAMLLLSMVMYTLR